ncbi:hypothetical protein [Absidia glauca]|uniref:EB1 C-terminal domain-containing protein n=1 Tax=Absidia glauca TaxID=4829 RepID=A0A168T666_ABSGL|nr:hypothetical protein [Absidia glauca]
MGESRTELLQWVNDLLNINYTKVEQAGTGNRKKEKDLTHLARRPTHSMLSCHPYALLGGAYCQIMDSIYGDVAMNKVKFDTRQDTSKYFEWYRTEERILTPDCVFLCPIDQSLRVDKIIPIDKLMKCKFQDNLEFMQWMKRFWDQNFPGGPYNALARRKGGSGGGGARTATAGGRTATTASRTTATGNRVGSSATARSTSRAGGGSGRTSAGVDNRSASVIMDLNKQIAELKLTVDGLEKERDFYFGKLRDIEILVQEQVEVAEAEQIEDQEVAVLKEIQTILYSTEDGFEVPPEGELEEHEIYDEDETF